MRLFHFVLHTLLLLLLTALTQVGGLLWLICYWIAGRWKNKRFGRTILIFLPTYLLFSFAILPLAAGYFGRTPLPVFTSSTLKPARMFYPLFNRHYVTPHTKRVLQEVADQLRQLHPEAEVHYLDAGFPLFREFPLLPHLSHSDGRKVDLAFFYLHPDGRSTNNKPSRTGYGVFEGPTEKEAATAEACHDRGYWQYSYPQYLSMGVPSELKFDPLRTKTLLELILERREIGKIFLEPHLQKRLGLGGASKIRFQGCQAVRHDDHLHMQMEY